MYVKLQNVKAVLFLSSFRPQEKIYSIAYTLCQSLTT